jgi:hypothetical protein
MVLIPARRRPHDGLLSEAACRRGATEFDFNFFPADRLKAARAGVIKWCLESGRRRGARLECRAGRFQMEKLGIGGAVEQVDRLRQLQQGRRREQDRARHRDDGANGAIVFAGPLAVGA